MEVQCCGTFDRHSIPLSEKDLPMIMTTLEEANVFTEFQERKHHSFAYNQLLLQDYV